MFDHDLLGIVAGPWNIYETDLDTHKATMSRRPAKRDPIPSHINARAGLIIHSWPRDGCPFLLAGPLRKMRTISQLVRAKLAPITIRRKTITSMSGGSFSIMAHHRCSLDIGTASSMRDQMIRSSGTRPPAP